MTYEQILKKFLKAYNCAITINVVPNGFSLSDAYVGYVFNGEKCIYSTPMLQLRSDVCLDVFHRLWEGEPEFRLALGVDDMPYVEFTSPEELEMKLSVIGVL